MADDRHEIEHLRMAPFRASWAGIVATWAATADESAAWCSSPVWPVPATAVASWGDADDVDAYVLLDGDDPIAYGEVWTDDDEAETELARIIVSPRHRGGGRGRTLARLLAARAASTHPSVVLRVRPGNDAALRCYAGAGFERMPPDDELQFNVGQPIAYVWMRLATPPDSPGRSG